jgi:hypothetical protein
MPHLVPKDPKKRSSRVSRCEEGAAIGRVGFRPPAVAAFTVSRDLWLRRNARMRRMVLGCTLLGLFAGSAARAEIYEWRDKDGTKHFTNSTQGIPADYRSGAQVMMEDKSATQPPPEVRKAEAPKATTPSPRKAHRLHKRTDRGPSGE